MPKGIYTYCAATDHAHAMQRVSLGLRRGCVAEAKEWLAVAERIMRMQDQVDEVRMADDRREAWRKEQPHRQKVLESRARWAR